MGGAGEMKIVIFTFFGASPQTGSVKNIFYNRIFVKAINSIKSKGKFYTYFNRIYFNEVYTY